LGVLVSNLRRMTVVYSVRICICESSGAGSARLSWIQVHYKCCCRTTIIIIITGTLHSEIVGRRCLRSADTTTLQVPSTRRATLGDHTFLVATARA